MKKAEWIRLMRIAKAYGLNHYRFHSWFPPEAALEAADELGLLFETRVGQGKLLVCASDLPALQVHPEARQLMHSSHGCC